MAILFGVWVLTVLALTLWIPALLSRIPIPVLLGGLAFGGLAYWYAESVKDQIQEATGTRKTVLRVTSIIARILGFLAGALVALLLALIGLHVEQWNQSGGR